MISIRQRALVAIAALLFLAIIGYYSTREPVQHRPVSNIGTKLAEAKNRLKGGLEEQNQQLKQALEAARASIKQAAAPPAAATATAVTGAKNKANPSREGFAYVFYATNDNYACSVLVNIRRLKELLHTAIAIHVLASEDVSEEMLQAIRSAGAVLHIQSPPAMPESASPYYQYSLLKLRAFEMHRLSPGLTRVLALDADQLVMQNLDDLFTNLPTVDLAAPRAYWLQKDWISSTFLLISLSDRLWDAMQLAVQRNSMLSSLQPAGYDMELVNEVLGDTVMMLGGEYACLNSHWEDWNLPRWYHPQRELNWTTINMMNELAGPPLPSPADDAWSKNKGKRQLFTNTDIAVEAPPTASLQMAQPSPNPLLPSSPSPPIAHPIPLNPVEPSPRFPLTHPLALELEHLQDTAAVLHFSALGKPWTFAAAEQMVGQARPDAHPLLAVHFAVWRDTAEQVCPGGAAARAEPQAVESAELVAAAAAGGMWETVTVTSRAAVPSVYVRPLSGWGVAVSTTW